MGEKGGRRRLLNNVAEGGMEKGGGSDFMCTTRQKGWGGVSGSTDRRLPIG
jgi:hypothetical protein